MTTAAYPTPPSTLATSIAAAANVIRARFPRRPDAAVILGTGLGRMAEEIVVEAMIPYAEIPGFPVPTVEAHQGRLLCGTLAGKSVIAMQGRFHRYEGYTLQQVTLPVRVLRAVGAPVLIVSNACGGMNPAWKAGDLMLIRDHINLIGDNPLVGPNDDALGPRFPDMSAPYDEALAALARETAAAEGLTLREGVYVGVAGPNLETRAEYRMLRGLGADVVGMSTVPEVIVAVHAGLRVLGLSIITDECIPETLTPTSLATVIAVARAAEPKLGRVVTGVLERM
jgi:purine-nucleoside phosphorylase